MSGILKSGHPGSGPPFRGARMRVVIVRALLILSTVLLAGFATPLGEPAPVLVELFTSEGCSSCPPADALLQRIASGSEDGAPPSVIALGEHVDYWDQQGWKDRFSSAAFTRRQQVYAARFNTESIYTPQMVVDGRAEFVGSDAAAARRAIERAAAAPHGVVTIQIDGSRRVTLTASALPPDHERADILVAITENGLTSRVTRGENHGRVLSHAAVVRALFVAGEASGADAVAHTELAVGADWAAHQLTVVAFVQERRSRAILAASAVPLVPRP